MGTSGIALVTGATSGLGFETAAQLAAWSQRHRGHLDLIPGMRGHHHEARSLQAHSRTGCCQGFAAARGLLRTILSEYLHVPPHRLRCSYSSHGKPALAVECEGGGVRFNVSHSRDMALYAISRNREVGVDIENVKARSFQEEIAERFFSPEEVHWLRGLPREKQAEAFYECWTRKEAYLKARGDGLALPIKPPIIPAIPSSASTEPTLITLPDGDRSWSFWRLEPAPGYIGALVVEGECRRLQRFQWPHDLQDENTNRP